MFQRIITYFRSSLTARLTFWVSVAVVFLFVVSIALLFHFSRKAIENEALQRADRALENTMLKASNIMNEVEFAANNTRWVVERHIDTPDSMFTYSREIVSRNPNFMGCSIAFEQYHYPEYGEYFAPYSMRVGDDIVTWQEGNDNYKYFFMDWYLVPKVLDAPYWTDPYSDVYYRDSAQVVDYVTSYCLPIRSNNGWTIGALAVDLSVSWFSKTVSETRPFPNSYSLLLSKSGVFLVHPDSTKVYNESLLTPTLDEPDSLLTEMYASMKRGENGYRVLEKDGEDYYIFYRPFSKTDWTVAIVCPKDDIFAPYKELQITLIVIMSLGLLLLVMFTIDIIRHHMRPLQKLAGSVESFADGQFDTIAEDTSRSNEIGTMQHSFSKMQRSLADYIQKIKESTSALQKQNEALTRANELSMEDNRAKTSVITNMTDQMFEPVNQIADESKVIANQYDTLSEEEMAHHMEVMLDNTNQVIQILDTILEASNVQSKPADNANV